MYQIQSNKPGIRNNCFSHLTENNHSAPNEHESMLFSAVVKALNAGLSYTTDVYGFVVNEMSSALSEQVLASGKDRVEHGHFGMDIYHMRYDVVQPMNERRTNKAAMKILQIAVGLKIKGLRFGSHKFATTTITNVDEEDGSYGFNATKRGTKTTWSGRVKESNCDLERAINGQ
jgi:hypothetical protein